MIIKFKPSFHLSLDRLKERFDQVRERKRNVATIREGALRFRGEQGLDGGLNFTLPLPLVPRAAYSQQDLRERVNAAAHGTSRPAHDLAPV